MKKATMILMAAILLLTPAFAAVTANSVSTNLSFNGNEAVCEAVAVSDDGNAAIDVTMSLYQGSSLIDSWSDSGYGVVIMTEYATVDMGDYYTLEVEATINGRTYTDSVGGMCE